MLGEPVGEWVEDDGVHACVCNTLIHRKAILEKLLFPLTALVCVCYSVQYFYLCFRTHGCSIFVIVVLL